MDFEPGYQIQAGNEQIRHHDTSADDEHTAAGSELPVCATGLILHDDGTSPPRAECRLCGWSDTWTGDHADGGDQ